MGRNFLIEYDIPSAPRRGILYACSNPTCRTHFVFCPPNPSNKIGFDQCYVEFLAVDFDYSIVNVVRSEEENVDPMMDHNKEEENVDPMMDHNKVTKDLNCVNCNDKVGLRLITKNPDGIGTHERDLLFVNKLVVFYGFPQPRPMAKLFMHYLPDEFHLEPIPHAIPQAEPQDIPQAEPQDIPQAEPQNIPPAEPQADLQANPLADPQTDPLQPPAN